MQNGDRGALNLLPLGSKKQRCLGKAVWLVNRCRRTATD